MLEVLGSGQSASCVALQVVNTAVVATNMPFNKGAAGKENQKFMFEHDYTELHFQFSFRLTWSGSIFVIYDST